MSLATRCIACGTVFRVVQDQLKVSEGWVRCGRCNEVFNALEGLFDLDRDSPPEWRQTLGEIEAGAATLPLAGQVGAPKQVLPEKVDAQPQAKTSPRTTPAARVIERERIGSSDAHFEPEAADDIDESIFGFEDEPSNDAHIVDQRSLIAKPPQFVRHAERRARWSSPAVSIALSLCFLLFLIVLIGQAAHHFRDIAVARWPALRPVYVAWCNVAGCKIAAPERINNISVESTTLMRDVAPDAFRLSVQLRNHGDSIVALPSIDLSLTDPSGALVARRVLAPQLAPHNTVGPIPPGGESSLQWILTTGNTRVTGYTVEIFYP